QELGFHPEVISAGRRVNDEMGRYVAWEAVRLLIQAGKSVRGSRVLVLGITYKEDVRDTRNSRVFDLIRELEGYGCEVFVYDPLIPEANPDCLDLAFVENPFKNHSRGGYDAVVLAVPHQAFREQGLRACLSLLDPGLGVLMDVKGVFYKEVKKLNPNKVLYWSL
ncbi:MAG: UDP binding domain-containing protein, partial [Thermoflexus sp.]